MAASEKNKEEESNLGEQFTDYCKKLLSLCYGFWAFEESKMNTNSFLVLGMKMTCTAEFGKVRKS